MILLLYCSWHDAAVRAWALGENTVLGVGISSPSTLLRDDEQSSLHSTCIDDDTARKFSG